MPIRSVMIATVLVLSGAAAAALAEESKKKNSWEFFDYGEERGWSNENDSGNALAINGCVLEARSRTAVFRLTGYMDKYLSGEAKKDYFITVILGENEDNMFSTPSEYFGTEFMFQTVLPKDLKTASLKICARAGDGNPPDPECNTFKGPGFAKMVKDLCG